MPLLSHPLEVLAQCFELGPYDQLLKPAYMDKVAKQGDNPPPAELGDYVQVAVRHVPPKALRRGESDTKTHQACFEA